MILRLVSMYSCLGLISMLGMILWLILRGDSFLSLGLL
jgi:hypothetical protein